MKRSWIVTIVLALSIGLNIGLLYHSFAGHGAGRIAGRRPFINRPGVPGPPGPHFEMDHHEFALHRLHRMAEKLGIDEDQRAEMRAVLEDTAPEIMEERRIVQEARVELHEEYMKVEPDPMRVRAIVQTINKAQGRLDSLVAETMLRETGLLTPEQRQRYLEAMPWEGGMKGGQGRRHRDRPGRGD